MNKYEPYVKKIYHSKSIDNELVDFITTSHKRYIYGNGLQAAVCIGIFRDMGIKIEGLILPPGCEVKLLRGYWGRLMKRTFKWKLQDLNVEERRNAYVIMAIPREEYKAAEIMLEAFDVDNVMGCCWQHNSELNDICYEVWADNE